ncbi:MAG: glycoside hydrolase family 127 protein [Candidatus Aminicenantes bacterium]|nr:glycoside hydrolase family 127 protein [Candidatus Aminicenantes bacterium]
MNHCRHSHLINFGLVFLIFLMALNLNSQTFIQPVDPIAKDIQTKLLRTKPLPLEKVRLTGGPLYRAQHLTAQYLLQLEPDRMLAYYRMRAGLQPKAEPYGGWDGPGRNLTGHIAGHYLSAASLMYAATGDVRFKERVDYLVKELKEVQDKHGDGYLSALEGGRQCFEALARGEIKSASFDLNGQWSPWYTLHKTFAGLRDAYRLTGNKTALEVEIKFATWAEKILANLNDKQIQQMLNTEFGGMNEVLVDLFADTGDRRWLELARQFEHRVFVDPLKRHQDILAGKHGNTAIPKMIGSAVRYLYTGNAEDLMAASFFWDRVVHHHSYSTGGHGLNEYFGRPDELGARVDGRTSESCNVYNMLKLTRLLFALWPDAHYADFMERALFNHVLGSIDPEDGRMCYMVPVGRAVQREYQDMFRSFTCCVGSGMENHALHGLGIYYESENKLWVNLFVPSKAEWAAKKVWIEQETDFPEGEVVKISLKLEKPQEFILALRKPWWVTEDFEIKVNSQPIKVDDFVRGTLPEVDNPQYFLTEREKKVSAYVEIKRIWKSGDLVEMRLPKKLHLEPTPDDPTVTSILWGPLVLAADLGPERERIRRGEGVQPPEQKPAASPVISPLLVASPRPVNEWVKPVADKPGNFRIIGVGRTFEEPAKPIEIDLVPFYRLHKRVYSAYFDYLDEKDWEKRLAAYRAEKERQKMIENRTITAVQLGDQKAEKEVNFQAGDNISIQRVLGRPSRRGSTWFSFELPTQSVVATALLVTYYTEDRQRESKFRVLIEGEKIADEHVSRAPAPRFIEKEYLIPDKLVKNKNKIAVRFEAHEGSEIAPVVFVRLLR